MYCTISVEFSIRNLIKAVCGYVIINVFEITYREKAHGTIYYTRSLLITYSLEWGVSTTNSPVVGGTPGYGFQFPSLHFPMMA